MKIKVKLLLIILFFGATIAALAADVLINSFHAESTGNSVILRWTSKDEANLSRFEVERASIDKVFNYLNFKPATGKSYSDYTYYDEEAFMKQGAGDDNPKLQSQKIYFYRLKLVYKDGSTAYSDEVSLTHRTNSVKRTWGMIKEMFR